MTNPFRSQFPIFDKYPNLAYLDNAATNQRLAQVIQTMTNFYSDENANVHRGVYDLSNRASKNYEAVRIQIGNYFGGKAGNIAFTTGTTESINSLARSYLKPRLNKGDNVVVSIMEHHSNFVPWQQLAKEKGAEFRVAPIDGNGDIDMKALNNLMDSDTKMLAVTHVSNTLGTINDLTSIVTMAHKKGIPVTVDAAQSAAFYDLDQKEIGYDFLACSGHKMFGPFGTGILYVSDEHVDQMQPNNFGGGMIKEVTIEETSFADFPKNIEGGTPNIGGVIGLSSAFDFLQKIDREEARSYVQKLGEYCREQLDKLKGVKVIGHPKNRTGIVSFEVNNIHPHDVASFLNKDGISVRAGMHCTQPLLQQLGIPSTVRASFSIYNSQEEIDRLSKSLAELIKFWS